MISIRYQLFFYNPNENRERRLNAIQPFFNSPSAIRVLLKTAKFEGKQALVYSGLEDALGDLLKQVERLDMTDWLDYDFDEISKGIDALAEKLGIARFEITTDSMEEQVLGDPPMMMETDKQAVEAAKKKKIEYPTDIPEKNHWLWDDIKKNYRGVIRARGGKDQDRKEAVHRILYTNSALRLGMIPFSFTTKTQVNDARDVLSQDIESGEAKASEFIETWERHLKSDGTLKKTKVIRYLGSEYEETSSRYYIAHVVEWSLSSDWKSVFDYLTKNHGFHVISKDHLSMTINRLTKLEVIQDEGDKIAIYISHVFTPHQAATLTGKDEKNAIIKMMHKYSTLWYKEGRFPDLKKF